MNTSEGIARPNVNQVHRVKAKNICFVDDTKDSVLVPYSLKTLYRGVPASVRMVISIPVYVVVLFSIPLRIVTSSTRLSW